MSKFFAFEHLTMWILILSAVSVLILSTAVGQHGSDKPISHDDASAEAVLAEPVYEFPSDKLDEMKTDYLETIGMQLGANEDGSWIAWSVATISREPGPGWGTSRIAAFGRAEEQNRAQLVSFIASQVATQTAFRFFQDDSVTHSPVEQSGEEGRLERIKEKILTASEKKLDQVLLELGMSEAEIEAMSAPKKRVALEEHIQREVISRSMGAISGFRIIQTFEGRVGNNYAVGVLSHYSPKYKDISRIILQGGGRMVDAPRGKSMNDWLPDDASLLLKNYGIRVLPDQNGEPLVVAFSQVGVNFPPGSSEKSKQRRIDAAYRAAEELAKGMITDFASASTYVERSTTMGETTEESVEIIDGQIGRFVESPAKIEQVVSESIHTRGRLTIKGGTRVKNWRSDHPETGEPFVGVVYVWSPSSARIAEGIRVGRKAEDPEQAEADNSTSGTEGTRYPVGF